MNWESETMRRRAIVIAGLTAPLTGFVPAVAAASPVVLELFTSQGCSSCPPADSLLGELSQQPRIIALAWHVDYWNSLGWRDPFARAAWTDRQKDYARTLGEEVYTPALVVNGAAMVVGSDRAAVRHAIERAAPPSIAVTLRRVPTGTRAEFGAGAETMTAMLIAYDPRHDTQIGAGENQGRRLTEYRVVRDVTMFDRPSAVLTLPSLPPGQGAVLLLRDNAGRVLGAADLPSVGSA